MAASSTNDAVQAALSLAEQAEAEAAKATAEAEAARERAAKLQDGHDSGPETEVDPDDAESESDGRAESDTQADVDAVVEDSAEGAVEDDAEDIDAAVSRNRRRIALKALAVTAPIVLLCALLATSGWFIWTSHQAAQERARSAEFSAAARQGVVNLMSLNYNNSEADIQRLIDSTTGQFREDFEKSKDDFITVMKDSKVVTEASVKATGVEKMTDDSATVLVAASSQVSNAASAQQAPRSWRFSVDLTRDDGQLKMSKVEFVL